MFLRDFNYQTFGEELLHGKHFFPLHVYWRDVHQITSLLWGYLSAIKTVLWSTAK